MKVKIDTKKCIACGQCVNIAPDIFELRDVEGEIKAQIKKDAELKGNKDAVLDAEEGCPTGAILLEEDKCGAENNK